MLFAMCFSARSTVEFDRTLLALVLFMTSFCRRNRALLGLALLCVLAFAPPILGLLLGYFPLGEDALAYFAPLRSWAGAQIRGGTIPLWNPYLYGGQPLAANIQTALWYPPNAVYWLLPERFAVLSDALLHCIWLAWGAFAFARALGFNRRAAFLAGAVLALGGGTSARIYAGQTIWLAAFSHLPWLLRAELKYLRNGQMRDALFAGAWLGLVVLAGHPPTALLAALLSLALVVLWIATRQKAEAKLPRGWLWGMSGTGVVALSLSAVAWLPFRELSKLAEHGGALQFADATVLSATWRSFVRLLAPDWFGGNRGIQWSQNCCAHEETASIGVLPLVLAIAAFFVFRGTVKFDRTHRARKLILCALPFIFLLALGASTPFYGWVFEAFAPLQLVRVPSRWLLVWFFIAPFLAARAWQNYFGQTPNGNEQAASNEQARTKSSGANAVAALLRGIAFLGAIAAAWALLSPESFWQSVAAPFAQTSPALAPEVAGNFRRVALIESATVFLLAGLAGSFIERWRKGDARARPRLALLLLAFACFEGTLGFWRGAKLVSPKDQNDAFWPREIVAQHQAGERWTTSIFWQGINRAATENVPLANGYDPLGTKNYFAFASHTEGRKFWETLYQPQNRSALWRVAGVSHTLAQTPDTSDAETPYPDTRGWTLEKRSGRWELWSRNEGVWPHVYLASSVWKTHAPLPLLEQLAATERTSYPVVVAPNALPQLTASRKDYPAGSTRIVSENSNRLSLAVDANRDSALVVSDANFPGWRAWVNGKETKVETANGMFRAMEIPQGKSRVEMVFDSQTTRLGMFLSLCGLVILAALNSVRSNSTVLIGEENESDKSE